MLSISNAIPMHCTEMLIISKLIPFYCDCHKQFNSIPLHNDAYHKRSYERHWDCTAYDKHICAMKWNEIAHDNESCAMHCDCIAYDQHSCVIHWDALLMLRIVVQCNGINLHMTQA